VRGLRDALATATPEARRELRAPFERRMGSLPEFMKGLKQRFTLWFNGRHKRAGTLWEGRYHSTVVDPEPSVRRLVAAYIDLNPVRAGLAEDPKDWAWSGYGATCGGDGWARRELGALFGEADGISATRLADYRVVLFETGAEGRLEKGRVPANRAGISPAKVAEVRRRKGKLGLAEALRCRVAYFTRGGAIGGRAFVEGVFTAARDRFPIGRKDGARPWRGVEGDGLWSLRDLRVAAYGPPARG
jgi:putative transposase